jgi:hypothetical protein
MCEPHLYFLYRICDSICVTHKTFQLFKICGVYIFSQICQIQQYACVTYFKQLEGFVHDTYAITYSIYVNTNAAHTYPYYIFYLNGPLKLKILDLVYCLPHILPQTLILR